MSAAKSLLPILLLLAIVGGVGRAAESPTAPYAAAVVTLYSYDKAGKAMDHSTGFFVTADGLIATTRHPFKDAARIVAETSDGKKHTVLGIVAADREHDLVIVRVEGKGFPFLQEGSYKEVHGGAQIVMIGDPTFAKGKITAGKVKEVSALAHNYDYFLTDTPPGDEATGSPVLDKDYRLVGLLRAQPGDAAHGFVVPVTAIQTLLADAAAKPAPPQPVDRLETRHFDELNDDANLQTAMTASAINDDDRKAIRLLEQVRERSPNGNGTVEMLLALEYPKVGKGDEEMAALNAAVRQNPYYALAWSQLALEDASAGQKQPALDAANKVAVLGTDDPVVWRNVAATYSFLKMDAEVRKVIERLRSFRTPMADRYANTLAEDLPPAPAH